MAITTVAGLLAAPQRSVAFYKNGASFDAGASHCSMWTRGYHPAAGAAPSAGLNGATCDNTTTGALEYTNATSGNQMYLGGLEVLAHDNTSVYLMDRLWANSGIVATTTGEQGITSPTFPARDREGGTTGLGCMIFMELSTPTGAGGAVTNTTVRYTNSAGTGNRTATLAHTGAGGLVANYTAAFALEAGDTGVQSIEGITLGTTYSSGAGIHLVVARLIAIAPLSNTYSLKNSAVKLGLPKLYDGSCLYFIAAANTATGYDIIGQVTYVQG